MVTLYAEGRSDLAVCKEIGLSKKRFNHYYDNNPSFRELVDYGRELAQAWWEDQSRINLQNKDFNANLYKTRMANAYGWHDKVQTDNKNVNAEMDLARLRQELVDRLPEVMKLIPAEQVKHLAGPSE
jgi:hypothetical protein